MRLGLIAVLFIFVFAAALTMRSGLRAPTPARGRQRRGSAAPQLVVVTPGESGLAAGAQFAVAGELTIGRAQGNSIVVNDPSVSSEHAEILRGGREWRVRDLGSTNGTLVDGRPAGRGMPLRGGETITLGSVRIRFQA